MPVKLVRTGEFIPAKVFTFDDALPTDDLSARICASLSSPTFSYDFSGDVNDPALIIAEHHLPRHDRLELAKTDIRAIKHDICNLFNQNRDLFNQNRDLFNQTRDLRYELQELRCVLDTNLTTQLHWETRSRIAQALNDTHTQELDQEEEYQRLKLKGYTYLPAVLSSWAIFTNREPATRLLSLGVIDNEAESKHSVKMEALKDNGLEASIEYVWRFIPDLERNVMISMFLTRPNNRNGIAHPNPTVNQGKYLIDIDPLIPQDEKDFITTLIPMAKDKSQKLLFSSG